MNDNHLFSKSNIDQIHKQKISYITKGKNTKTKQIGLTFLEIFNFLINIHIIFFFKYILSKQYTFKMKEKCGKLRTPTADFDFEREECKF